jgi:hypothetical protein
MLLAGEDFEALYAFFSVDKDNNKKLMAVDYPGKDYAIPLICLEDMIEDYKVIAQDMCKINGLSYEIVRFIKSDVVGKFTGYS